MTRHSVVARAPRLGAWRDGASRYRAAALAGATVFGLMAAVGAALHYSGLLAPLFAAAAAEGDEPDAPRDHASGAEDDAESNALPEFVELTPEKLAAATIAAHPLAKRTLRPTRTVPGRLEFNGDKRLEITAPVAAVVKEVAVAPGSVVKRGDRLAVLASAEIGLARDEVLQSEAELRLAKREAERAAEIEANVAALLERLDERPKLADVEAEFQDRSLGDDRERVLGAYSKLLLAEAIAEDVAGLTGAGALSNRAAQQRTSEREVASAAFLAARERARFAVRQERDRTQAAAEHAERLLRVRREHVQTLLGRFGDASGPVEGALGELAIVAPFDARIDERRVVPSQRLAAGERLFLVSDGGSLWVSAEVREAEWNALAGAVGTSVAVRFPAAPERSFTARVKHIGSEVALDTRALPLVAELENPDGRFRPGMFVWIDVPLEEPREAPAVPAAALTRHEGETFVFVQEGPRRFRRAAITPGAEIGGWVEVASSAELPLGALVVDEGAFLLKSELLLDRLAED